VDDVLCGILHISKAQAGFSSLLCSFDFADEPGKDLLHPSMTTTTTTRSHVSYAVDLQWPVTHINDCVRTSVSPSFWYIPTVNPKNKRTFLGFVGIGCNFHKEQCRSTTVCTQIVIFFETHDSKFGFCACSTDEMLR
jgi:hypothetical protein